MLTFCPSDVFRGDIHFSIAESGKMDTPNISGIALLMVRGSEADDYNRSAGRLRNQLKRG
jgi:hypothetical protein